MTRERSKILEAFRERRRAVMEGRRRLPWWVRIARLAVAVAVGILLYQGGIRSCVFGDGESAATARNVILFIGDGFGMSQFALGAAYASQVEGRTLAMVELANGGSAGYALPFSFGRVVTDSAAAASQMATGESALSETLSVSATSGEPTTTVLEEAEERGLATGLVSNMRLTHATPVAFAAHAPSRYVPEADLAEQLLSEHDVDVVLGGGGRAMVPQGSRFGDAAPGIPETLDGASNRSDDRDLIAEAAARGRATVFDRAGLREAAGRRPLLGVFGASTLPYVLDRRHSGLDATTPSLPDMTRAAIASLESAPEGFFLMVEGGLIDYAGHDNDAGAMLAEVLEFDEAIAVALGFARRRGDTLVLVTADHGTGGFSFTYGGADAGPKPPEVLWDYRAGREMAGPSHLRMLAAQERSLVVAMRDVERPAEAEGVREVLREATGIGLTDGEAADLARQLNVEPAAVRDFSAYYTDPGAIPSSLAARFLGNHTMVVWSTGGHTSEPVPLFGYGPGSDRVRGVGVNTRVAGIIRAALFEGR